MAGVELPDTIGEDWPSHPLDPEPLVQSTTQLVGASLGLGLLAARRLAGIQGAPLNGAAEAAGVVGLLEGFPATREGLRSLLGRHTADLLFAGTGVLALTLSGSPLGLALSAAGALRLFTEVRARKAAFRRYEERLRDASSAQPGTAIRLKSGERTPLAAGVIEGTGTAGGRDGLPVPVAPGQTIDAGARLYGGPFVLELKDGQSFTPESRPAPVPKSLYERYMQASGLLSLGYAALTALLTRSFSRTFMALVLVNPRTAVIGKEGADTSASARVLHSGVTVVGTRPDRVVRLPGVLLLDGPRMLTDGLEISSTLPLGEDRDASEILSQAAGVTAASGSPWGRAFASLGRAEATDGSFDGKAASALIGNTRYSLRPPEDRDQVPAAMRFRSRGEYVLLLESEREEHPLGVLALRPKLAIGVTEMIQTCRRQGVETGLLGAAGDPLAAQAVARRAEVPLLPDEDAVSAVRARQEEGGLVALVSDSAGAAEAFEACDIAVGLSSGCSSHFPARADLLAPDLSAVAAIIDAGARRDAAVRDSVGLSIISNVFGAAWGFEGRPGARWASTGTYITALSALAVGWARLRGGERPGSTGVRLADPNPER